MTAENHSIPHRGRWRAVRRLMATGACSALAVGLLSLVPGATAFPFHASPSVSGAASACQSDGSGGCTATIPCTSGPCPSVDVAPATSLRDGQYVFITAQNFPSSDSIRVALCSANSTSDDPSCLLGQWEEETWQPIQVPISTDSTGTNVTKVSYPAFFDPNVAGNVALPAHDITNQVGAVPGFFCGDAADPCEMVVTEEAGQGNGVGFGPPVSSSNSVIVPLAFTSASNGCPTTDPIVQTDSSFSVEQFLPAAVEATCGSTNGVVALNTATDNHTVVSDLAAGGATVAFVDNPADPSTISALAGKPYAFIPMALSATVVSFLAGESLGAVSFPVSSYRLTPNMVAGLITSAYQYPEGNIIIVPTPQLSLADNLIPPLDCTNLVGCPAGDSITQLQNEQQYNTFELLNPVGAGFTAPQEYGSFLSNVPSGASYQATDWLCHAPNDPFDVSVDEVNPPAGQANPVSVKVTDPNTAPTTFTTAPIGSDIWPPFNPAPPWVFPTCQPYATLPPLSGTEPNFSESESPALQAKYMRGWSYGGGSLPAPPDPQTPLAAFGIMDSSEAAFYGLNDASLQNATGDFVAPTADALEDGAADLTPCASGDLTCPLGAYAMNYDATSLPTDPAAYPMPDVTYAVVSTAPQPAAQAAAVKNLLTNLLNFSHTGGAQLPAGYAPLPDSMYTTAMADLANDIVAQPTSAAAGSSGGASGVSTSAGSAGSAHGRGTSGEEGTDFSALQSLAAGIADTSPVGLPLSSPSGTGSSGTSKRAGGGRGGKSTSIPSVTIPIRTARLLLGGAARFLLPALAALALACFLLGPLLLFVPAFRRRRRSAR